MTNDEQQALSTVRQMDPEARAEQLVEAAGFDGAEAEADLAFARSEYLEMYDLAEYWELVSASIKRLRHTRN